MRESMKYDTNIYQLRESVLKRMIQIIQQQRYIQDNSIVFYGDSIIEYYDVEHKILYGSKDNLNEIAQNIFKDLRKVDEFEPDIVIIEGVKEDGIGLAIMNRLIRACEYHYIKL